MTIRLAFAGASGTGKTYLTTRLATELRLEVQPPFARAVAAELGFVSPYDVDAAGKRSAFQKRVLARLLAWQHDHAAQGFIADRSAFDVLAYTAIHCDARTYDECAEAVRLNILQGALRYDRLVLCPMASFFKVGSDPARVADPAYHLNYERLLRQIIAAFPVALDLSLEGKSDVTRPAWIQHQLAGLRP